MPVLHHRHAEYTIQRRFYAAVLYQKYRVSCAEKVLCFCYMTVIESILCREGFMLLLYERNTEYPMKRRFFASVS
jgi:hypothetical protein